MRYRCAELTLTCSGRAVFAKQLDLGIGIFVKA
jgi:hypothetical protein